MGITIHYKGELQPTVGRVFFLEEVSERARSRNWSIESFEHKNVELERCSGDDGETLNGDAWGVVIQVHEACEPLTLEFDRDRIFQDWIKTQYAPIDVHKQVVGFFDELLPFFKIMEIDDEGEYWESRDEARLSDLISECDDALKAFLDANPGSRGPVKLSSGRIVDVISE